MELHDVQLWIASLSEDYETLLQEAQLYSQLLGEIKKPWLLSQTPGSVQDSYKRKMIDEQKKEEHLVKLSQLDAELNNIDTVLQRARLLYKPDKKARKKSPHTQPSSNTDNIKEQSKMTAQEKGSSMILKTNGKILAPNKSKGTAKKSVKIKQGQLGNRAASTMHRFSKPTSDITRRIDKKGANSVDQLPNSHSPTNNRTNGDPVEFEHSPSVTVSPRNAAVCKKTQNHVENTNTSDIDITKVEVQFQEVRSHLSVPLTIKKLDSTYNKFREHTLRLCKDTVGVEEMTFFKNLCNKSGCHEEAARSQSQNSLASAAMKCIQVCMKAIDILKKPKTQSSPITKQHFSACRSLLTLNVVEEILCSLKIKYSELSSADTVNFDDTLRVDLKHQYLGLIYAKSQHLQGAFDGVASRDEVTYFKSLSTVRKLHTERLLYQCLVIEYELVRRLTESYFALISRLCKNERDEVPSQDLIHVIQNAYGVLGQDDILLPAFVLAE